MKKRIILIIVAIIALVAIVGCLIVNAVIK